ncbi:MAG: hypothetical protein ACM3JI_05330, partial [Anaerolineae bacterium]
MKNRLRLLIAASSILSLTSLYANSSTAQENPPVEPMHKPHRSSDVFLTSPNYCFAFQFSALFLQPTSSNLHYVAEALPLPAPTPNWRIYEIHPDYHFGFDVGLNAMFHKTNTNLML